MRSSVSDTSSAAMQPRGPASLFCQTSAAPSGTEIWTHVARVILQPHATASGAASASGHCSSRTSHRGTASMQRRSARLRCAGSSSCTPSGHLRFRSPRQAINNHPVNNPPLPLPPQRPQELGHRDPPMLRDALHVPELVPIEPELAALAHPSPPSPQHHPREALPVTNHPLQRMPSLHTPYVHATGTQRQDSSWASSTMGLSRSCSH